MPGTVQLGFGTPQTTDSTLIYPEAPPLPVTTVVEHTLQSCVSLPAPLLECKMMHVYLVSAIECWARGWSVVETSG